MSGEERPSQQGNWDDATVAGFGDEWFRFDQSELGGELQRRIFDDYFAVFPWASLSPHVVGADIGCGSGRWAQLAAPRVGHLHLVDASDRALSVAKRKLEGVDNVSFHHVSVDRLPFADDSLDFAYSLGVLHHVPDTEAAVRSVAAKLKPGAPFLIYLYYAFDNRPLWFRGLWCVSDLFRRLVSRLPHGLRYLVSQILAGAVYWPMARLSRLLESVGRLPAAWPLAYYRDKSFYVMRTDALDRFGTRLERRFTRREIENMLRQAGFGDIRFSENPPYWCAVGVKSKES